MQPSAGLVLGHRYVLTERIAIGGMGEVWSAQDQVLRRTVAAKVLKAELLDAPEFVERFRAEARHAAALAHVGIAGVYDYGEDETGAFLVMELVPGQPLSQLLAKDPVPPLTTTLSILAQTAEALDAAHRGGVVHRDVKPGNIMVLPDGSVKVTDFGIARAIDAAAYSSGVGDTRTGPLTAYGQVIGTPQYMSPEQVSGDAATIATDVYSLGVIGYEMLAGSRPFPGDNPMVLALAHVHDAPPPLPANVPDGVRDLIGRALSKRIEDRPGSAAAFASELRTLQMNLTPAPVFGPVASGSSTAAAMAVAGATGVMPSPQMAGVTSTEIMPAAGVAVGAPLLVVDESAVVDHGAARRRRRRILALSLVALVSVAVVVLLVRRDHTTPLPQLDSVAGSQASSTTLAAAAAATPLATQVAAVSDVVIDPNVYIGLPQADVVTALQGLGLQVDTQAVQNARPAGTVVDVTPAGSIAPGSSVMVSVSTGDAGGKGDGKGGGKGGKGGKG